VQCPKQLPETPLKEVSASSQTDEQCCLLGLQKLLHLGCPLDYQDLARHLPYRLEDPSRCQPLEGPLVYPQYRYCNKSNNCFVALLVPPLRRGRIRLRTHNSMHRRHSKDDVNDTPTVASTEAVVEAPALATPTFASVDAVAEAHTVVETLNSEPVT